MLNDEQKKAVEIIEGPLRIVAGAGTGKTFTLIKRIEYLINFGVSPERILVLTFTNKAAFELKKRLGKIYNEKNLNKKQFVNPSVFTFHSLAAKLLRKFWRDDFEIVESAELREGEIGESKIFKNESKKKFVLDFDGLLDKFSELFQGKLLGEDISKKCQNLFDYVLVDEYQDVNNVQIEILERLVDGHGNLCVVGDGDQTIYSWRGSNPNSMQKFLEIFPNAKTVVLTKNYRNPPGILCGAEALIKNNTGRIEKNLIPVVDSDEKISLWESSDVFEENKIIFYLLEKYLGSISGMHIADNLDSESGGRRFNDIAFLYRTQSQGRRLAELLSKKGYPYQISSGEGLFDKKEIKNFLEDLKKFYKSDVCDIGKNFKEKCFSEWISENLDKFVDTNDFNENQITRLNHLVAYCVRFDDFEFMEALKGFLDEVKLNQEADNLVFADRINLLTLHAAKGLEFPIVFIFGLEGNEIPYKKSVEDGLLEEERRLFYVGMTRAKENLHLFYKRKSQGKFFKRSRFLGEIGIDNMIFEKLSEKRADSLKKKKFKKAQMRMF